MEHLVCVQSVNGHKTGVKFEIAICLGYTYFSLHVTGLTWRKCEIKTILSWQKCEFNGPNPGKFYWATAVSAAFLFITANKTCINGNQETFKENFYIGSGMRIQSVELNRQNMYLPRKFLSLVRCILQRPPFFARKNGRIGTASDSLILLRCAEASIFLELPVTGTEATFSESLFIGQFKHTQ